MKKLQHYADSSSNFMSIPIVRLDSGAVRIPVEFMEKLTPKHKNQKALRIMIKNETFWAWR